MLSFESENFWNMEMPYFIEFDINLLSLKRWQGKDSKE